MRRQVGVTSSGGTFRVQRQQNGHTIRASFSTIEEANAFSLAVTAAWAFGALPPTAEDFIKEFQQDRLQPDPGVPTRLDDLVELALVNHQRDKHLSDEWIKKPRGQWKKHGGFFANPDVRNLSRDQVHAFSRHLYEQQLSRPTANEYILLVRRACATARELHLVPTNVAEGVTGRHQDNPLRPRNRKRPRPLTPVEVKTLAAQFSPWLQLSVLLMYVACLRLSEAFGLELRDWDPVGQTLWVRRQGGLQKNEGRVDPYFPDEADGFLKTKSSRRKIPVPPALAEVIDRHIESLHGPCPEDPVLAETWARRRLISKPGFPKPRNTVVTDRWDRSLKRTGLDFDTLGFWVNRHFLRKSGSTVIGVGDIRGKLWSAYLGHKTPAEFGGSLTTVQHYFDLPDEELQVVADRWEHVIRESVGDLVIVDEWRSTQHMTVAQAADMLGVHGSHVRWLVSRGRLANAPDEEVEQWCHKAGVNSYEDRRMLSGPSVYAEIDRRSRMSDQLTQTDVARELGLSMSRVKILRSRGLLEATYQEDRTWSYERSSVEHVAALLTEQRQHSHLYIGAGQAALLLGISEAHFGAVYAARIEWRTTLGSEARQYLRSAVDAIASERGRRGA